MDFLLECIGFPPDQDLAQLVDLACRTGERVPWRDTRGVHLRLPLGAGLELRVERDVDDGPWSIYPYFQSDARLRLAVETVHELPDSRSDLLVKGRGNPPTAGAAHVADESFALSAILTDARRMPRDLLRGHVLAVSLAGFALDLEGIGEPREGNSSATPAARFADGGWIEPLGGASDPGGCVELCLRVAEIQALSNPLTKLEVQRLDVRAPGRDLPVFLSPWQLEERGLPRVRAGDAVHGVFLLTGRIAGGLRSATDRLGAAFG